MSNKILIDRIYTIKDELENDIHDSIKILKEIKIMINSENELSNTELLKVFKDFYRLYPTENINNEVIESIFNISFDNTNIRSNITNVLDSVNNIQSVFFNRNIHTINNFNYNELDNVSLLSISEHSDLRVIDENFNNLFLDNIDEQNFIFNEESVSIVLKEDCFNKLEKIKYKDIDIKYKCQDQCIISLDKFNKNSDIIILPCNHIFLLDQCKTWLLNNSHKCPICRKPAGESYPKIN